MVAHSIGIRIVIGVVDGGRRRWVHRIRRGGVHRERGVVVGRVEGWGVGVGGGSPPCGGGAERNAHFLIWGKRGRNGLNS